VICNAAKKNISNHFSHKLIATVKTYPLIYYEKKTHADDEKIVEHGI